MYSKPNEVMTVVLDDRKMSVACVGYVVVDIPPKKCDKESNESINTRPFSFLSSHCVLRVNIGWETNERKLKVYVAQSQPNLISSFYLTVCLSKERKKVFYPKKLVIDTTPTKCIWSLPISDIVKDLPGIEKWNLSLRFILQKDLGIEKDDEELIEIDHKLVQTDLDEVNSLGKLSEDFGRLLAAGIQFDLELQSGEQVIRCNKAILTARSNYFKEILQSTTARTVHLPYMDPAAFHAIMQYIYDGRLPHLNFETAKKIYMAGDICDVAGLKEYCIEFLIENLNFDNACECLVFAADDSFKQRVIKYIIDNKIPSLEEYWKPFSDKYLQLAYDVYDIDYKMRSQRKK